MVAEMKTGSVIIDVSIDQGGVFETLSVTNHTKPVFSKERVLEIIQNKKKIMEPFDTVFYHRTNKTEPSKLHFVQGGSYSKKCGRSVNRISRIRCTQQTYRKSLKRGGSSGNVDETQTDAVGVSTNANDAVVSPTTYRRLWTLPRAWFAG
jgi:hypothetical protein